MDFEPGKNAASLLVKRANATKIGIFWTILTTVLFVFPPEIPTTASNMNYCIAAFGVMFLIAGGTWVAGGRNHYNGPHVEMQSETIHGVNFDHENDGPSEASDELKAKTET